MSAPTGVELLRTGQRTALSLKRAGDELIARYRQTAKDRDLLLALLKEARSGLLCHSQFDALSERIGIAIAKVEAHR